MALGRFLYPPNDIPGNLEPQAFFALSDSIHVAWESYLSNTIDCRLWLAYYILGPSKVWAFIPVYPATIPTSGSITLNLDVVSEAYVGEYYVYSKFQSGNWANFSSARFQVNIIEGPAKPITWSITPTTSLTSSASSATSTVSPSLTSILSQPSTVSSGLASISTEPPVASMASNGTLLPAHSSVLRAGAIAGISVGAFILAVAALIAAVFLYRKRRQKGTYTNVGHGNRSSLIGTRLPHEVGLVEFSAGQRHQTGRDGYAWNVDAGDERSLMSPGPSPTELPVESCVLLEGDGHRWEMDVGPSRKM